ncbi:hypothetical protein N7523_010251 [Penicillium sp. IBT 18751x]|nr:hypothetical protein N7523_010251 [Penicillium sp. IBT 18751x]
MICGPRLRMKLFLRHFHRVKAKEFSPRSLGSSSALSSRTSLFLNRVYSSSLRPQSSCNTALAATNPEHSIFKTSVAEKTFSWLPSKPPLFDCKSDLFTSAGNLPAMAIMLDCATRIFSGGPLKVPDFSIQDCVNSLCAYFNFPGLCHSFIPENPFSQDFKAARCSRVLLLAIACRGIPFTETADKWGKQQLLFVSCMEELMQTRTNGTMRLDDLEAMALIIDFRYDNRHTQLNRFWKPCMTHEALILVTLRFRNRASRDSEPSATLTHADERYTLLYWHVYVLDSFRCLECKSIPFMPENALDLVGDLPGYQGEGYVHAILGLAVIARQIVQKFCNATVQDKGIEQGDIEMLYEQLYHWRRSSLPSNLRRPIHRRTECPAEYQAVGKLLMFQPADRLLFVVQFCSHLSSTVICKLTIVSPSMALGKGPRFAQKQCLTVWSTRVTRWHLKRSTWPMQSQSVVLGNKTLKEDLWWI